MTQALPPFKTLFSREHLDRLFPPNRSDRFFEALLGDAEEGAYDIRLAFEQYREHQLFFNFELHQRPGKCLACNLTYGLPKVFSRHPVIDIETLVAGINALMNGQGSCKTWRLGATRTLTPQLHVVPLIIDM